VHRRALGMVALFSLVAACGGSATATVTPTAKPTATAAPTTAASLAPPSASTSAAQGNFDTLTGNGWAKVVAAPDMYAGDALLLWGCVTKLEPATPGFRAQASNREKTDWAADGKLAVFTATKAALADLAEDDVVSLKVVGRGSTPVVQGGGSPMPVFEVLEVAKVGTCG
jgi:hypothetical protein